MISEYFAQIIETFEEAICISDRTGKIVYLNNRHEQLTGIPRAEFIGKSVQEMVHCGLFDVVLNPEIVQSKHPATRLQSLSDGRRVVIDGFPVFDDSGNVVLVVTYTRDISKLSELKEQMNSQKELLEAYQKLQSQSNDFNKLPVVIQSKSMKALYGQLSNVAQTDATILLLGETGVGKDVFARKIHELSERSDKPFVKADCGSMPENLIETELFGYAPGTFSGGNKNGKIGLVEAASGGTLFLDEIGELPLLMQTRLLRLLQDKEILRVGATSPQKVDVRIVAATNKNLEEEVKEGHFRRDLYYRLMVALIDIPPLRKRKADILSLAHLFLDFYCKKYKRNISFTQATETALLNHSWPGNIRELENLILGCVVSSKKNAIDIGDLPFVPAPESAPTETANNGIALQGRTMKEILENVEKKVLQDGMERVGNMTKLARELGLDRTTVFRKLKKYDKK